MGNADDQGKVKLVIKKGADAELVTGGLKFVACRREVDVIDGGITLYVWSTSSEARSDDQPEEECELLRFDFFRNRPHYHAPAENQAETAIEIAGHADAEAWGIAALTTKAAELVSKAGFDGVANALDLDALSEAGPALADLFQNLGELTETSYFEVDAKVIAGLR